MAKGGITFTDKASKNLGLLSPNGRTALANSIQKTSRAVVAAGVKRLRSSATPTGIRRAAGEAPRYSRHSDGRSLDSAWAKGKGPGREESGALVASVRYTVKGIGTAKVTGQAGFINPPSYLRAQEAIPDVSGLPLGAVAIVRATAKALSGPTFNTEARRIVPLSRQGRTMKLDD